ncbi:hypothetical protein IGI04_035389, partial [Brassica rapa subsp. trilocularis]
QHILGLFKTTKLVGHLKPSLHEILQEKDIQIHLLDKAIKSAAEPEVDPTPYSTNHSANHDICALTMSYLTNQEGFQTNWNRAKLFKGQDIMNFTSRRFLSPSICKYQALEEDSNPTMKHHSEKQIMGYKRDL